MLGPSLLLSLIASFIFIPMGHTNSVNVETFHMANSYTYMAVEDPLSPKSTIPSQYPFLLTTHLSYVKNPLILSNAAHNRRIGVLVNEMTTAFMSMGFRLVDGVLIGASGSFSHVQTPAKTGTALGDSTLFAKYRFLSIKPLNLSLGLMPEIIFNTGDNTLFTTDDSLAWRLRVMGEIIVPLFKKDIQIAGNIGYHNSPHATYQNIRYKERIFASLGMYFPFTRKFGATAEIQTSVVFPTTQVSGPGEYYAGLRGQLNKSWALQAGMSAGGFEEVRSVDYRAIASLKYIPSKRKKIEKTPEPTPEVEPAPMIPPPLQKKTYVLYFDFDKSHIDETAQKVLVSVSETIKENLDKIKNIRLEAHTDARGNFEYNKKLSERRAKSALTELNKLAPLPQEKIRPLTLGKQNILPFQNQENYYRLNRRVEIHIEFK